MSGSVKCLQVFVALLCIVQFVLGIVFLILGGMAYKESGAGLNAHSAAIFLLAVGCFIVLVALFGLCGAIAKNSCLLIVFCIFMSISLVLSIIVLIIGFALPGAAIEAASQAFNESMNNYSKDNVTKNSIDILQLNAQCCGYNGVGDWELNSDFKDGKLPMSCCSNSTFTATECSKTSVNKYHSKGCKEVIEVLLKGMLYGFGIIATITAIALFLTLLLASILTSKIRKEYNPV
ncbi:hypothetical protein HELRODRAFT_185090 [Helobdella robusta]|uniref:Tetraspanin n=1 Tax=Helobdella robusta TaxID=6412 RepID=T1FMD8_HELRO|nr:hypothetical protein HELRODRAFT_185090 [Helobdella robusta]ESN96562.1 hypothetical protein HELRODRAFT_185090 [Helobdella robusta]